MRNCFLQPNWSWQQWKITFLTGTDVLTAHLLNVEVILEAGDDIEEMHGRIFIQREVLAWKSQWTEMARQPFRRNHRNRKVATTQAIALNLGNEREVMNKEIAMDKSVAGAKQWLEASQAVEYTFRVRCWTSEFLQSHFVFLVFFVLCWRLDSSQMRDIVGQPNETTKNKKQTPEKKKHTKKTEPWGTCLSQSFPRIFCFCFFFRFFLIAFWFFAFLRLLSKHGSCHFGFYGFWKVEVFAILFWFLGSKWYQMGL